MSLPIFYIKNGFLHFGNKTVLQDIELYVQPGNRICLIGRNGSGKSSLMKIIYNIYELDEGELFKLPGISLGYLKQDIELAENNNIYDFILQQFKDPESNKYKADMILESLELDGNLMLNTLSGGQIRRAYLAKVLVLEPDILLLDEPTNHMDIKTIEWLEGYVNSYSGAVICISHDRAFLSATTNKIWWIDRGVLRRADKGFKHFDEWQEEIIREEEAVLRKLNKKLETENDWLGAGVTARRKRNQRRLAQLKQLRTTISSHANKLSFAKQKLKIELAEEVKKTNFIIEAKNLSFSYQNKEIIKDFTFRVKKGEKIGIIGPNGSGKSTLIRLLTKDITPAGGRVRHGTNLEISYIDQYKMQLNLHHSIKQVLCPDGGDQVFLPNRTQHVAAYLKQFMFDPKSLYDKASTLSGGQANRLLLAKALINPGNLLILDEPTNDLDMDSLEVLLEILADYNGTLLIVSHDRDFLEKLVTRTLVFTADKIIDLIGGYEDYKKFYEQDLSKKQPVKQLVKIFEPGKSNINNKTPKKLSYKHQRALITIPQEIEKLELRIIVLEQELDDPDLYLQNPKKFNKIAAEMADSREQIDKLMEEWVFIESLNSST